MTVKFPWPFGTILYLRVRTEKVKGMLTGYNLNENGFGCFVSWPDCSESRHFISELTTEYLPDYETS